MWVEKLSEEQLDISDSSTILNNVNYFLMWLGSIFWEETATNNMNAYKRCGDGQGWRVIKNEIIESSILILMWVPQYPSTT